MKVIVLIFLILVVGGFLFINSGRSIEDIPNTVSDSISQLAETTPYANNLPANSAERISVIAENLDTPWAIALLPDGNMLVTERKGTLCFLTKFPDDSWSGQDCPFRQLEQVKEIGEGGLLGVAIHPDFSSNKYIYLYYTYGGSGNNTLNRVVRMTFDDTPLAQQVTDEKIIVDAIPGAANHNGGRIKFGPDKFLYIATGDAQEPSRAQDTNNLAGKILRVTENGDPAPGNPFDSTQGKSNGDGRIYSYGHRNVQGLAWDANGQLWATEHGRSGALSGLDELNKIESGKNYGWPEIQGNETRDGMITAVRNSGNTTWAPAGMAFINGSFYFAGLRGETLYEAVLSGNSVTLLKEHLKAEYGRLREVVAGSDGMLYVTTSNHDGRGSAKSGDDKILRINPKKL